MYSTENLLPVRFYPYRSSVRQRIFETEFKHESDVELLREELHSLFNFVGIKNGYGNKVVFECEVYGHKIFFGFYDWIFSVGFGVESEHEGYGLPQ